MGKLNMKLFGSSLFGQAITAAAVGAALMLSVSAGQAQSSGPFAGFDGATFTNAPNSGVLFVTLKPFEERVKEKLKTATILNDLKSYLRPLTETR